MDPLIPTPANDKNETNQDRAKKTVVVGMSGGVDSSVSALILREQGFRVIGLFMRNWEEKAGPDGFCQADQDFEDVARVCEVLDIPYYSINLVQEYWDKVFTEFLNGYKAGDTPNPDILCNREIKFQIFFERAMQLGADYLATGHYCRRVPDSLGTGMELLKGCDPGKDQSYFLYTIKSSILEKVLFPIGDLHKHEVRLLAQKYRLPTHAKKDSTGICFIGERPFQQFLGQYLPYTAGEFQTLSGQVVGRHVGAAFYTMGQRKGLGLGGPGEAWYVVGKRIKDNVVVVERGEAHPALYVSTLVAGSLSWVSENFQEMLLQEKRPPFACKAKVRYRQQDQDCLIERIVDGDKIFVSFPVPQRAVTLKQSIVFYEGDVCLGGGIIEAVGPSYHERGLELPAVISN